jgi:hypothetical protein
MTSEGRIGSVPSPNGPPRSVTGSRVAASSRRGPAFILPASAQISPASCASSAEPEGPLSCGTLRPYNATGRP